MTGSELVRDLWRGSSGRRAGSWVVFLGFRLVCCCGFLSAYGKMCWGDSVEFGVFRGKAVVHGVFDGKGWAPGGGMGRTWDDVGGREGVVDRCAVSFLLWGASRG